MPDCSCGSGSASGSRTSSSSPPGSGARETARRALLHGWCASSDGPRRGDTRACAGKGGTGSDKASRRCPGTAREARADRLELRAPARWRRRAVRRHRLDAPGRARLGGPRPGLQAARGDRRGRRHLADPLPAPGGLAGAGRRLARPLAGDRPRGRRRRERQPQPPPEHRRPGCAAARTKGDLRPARVRRAVHDELPRLSPPARIRVRVARRPRGTATVAADLALAGRRRRRATALRRRGRRTSPIRCATCHPRRPVPSAPTSRSGSRGSAGCTGKRTRCSRSRSSSACAEAGTRPSTSTAAAFSGTSSGSWRKKGRGSFSAARAAGGRSRKPRTPVTSASRRHSGTRLRSPSWSRWLGASPSSRVGSGMRLRTTSPRRSDRSASTKPIPMPLLRQSSSSRPPTRAAGKSSRQTQISCAPATRVVRNG